MTSIFRTRRATRTPAEVPAFPGTVAALDGSGAVVAMETAAGEAAGAYPITPSTNMPAVYVIDMITSSQNVGQGMAAATMMLVPIIVLLSIVGIVGWRRRVRAEAGL